MIPLSDERPSSNNLNTAFLAIFAYQLSDILGIRFINTQVCTNKRRSCVTRFAHALLGGRVRSRWVPGLKVAAVTAER